MNLGTLFAGGLTAGLMVTAAAVYAAPSDVRSGADLLTYCPALETGSGCPAAAEAYLQYTNPSDGEIFELVIKIAEDADQPTVPKSICLDAAEGLRVLAGGVSSADRQQEIRNIADALCKDSATGAIGNDANDGDGDGNGNGGGNSSSQMSSESTESSSSVMTSQSSSSEMLDPSSMMSSEPTDNCAGNSLPTNGNNCDNPNNSDHSSSSSQPPVETTDCAGNSTPKNGQNCDNPNNS